MDMITFLSQVQHVAKYTNVVFPALQLSFTLGSGIYSVTEQHEGGVYMYQTLHSSIEQHSNTRPHYTSSSEEIHHTKFTVCLAGRLM